MNSRWPFCLFTLLAVLLAACRTPEPPASDARKPAPVAPPAPTNQTSFTAVTAERQLPPEWLRAPTNYFTLGPGDRLEIEVIGDLTTRATTVVGPDGKLYYYLLPGLDVWD